MLAKLSSHITDNLIQANAINQADEEIYRYGFKMIFTYAVNLITIFAVGLIMGRLWECFLFQLVFLPLRGNAGGYHASTELKCYILSVGLIVTSLVLLNFIPMWLSTEALLLLMLIACAIIFILAPVENKNKPLDLDEIRVYGYRARTVLVIEAVAALICYFLSWNIVFMVIVLGIVSMSGSLIAGVCVNKSQI
ncbi:MAG: accessory gene regulator ArgB-like protein [Lachnospiraceae bacterium]